MCLTRFMVTIPPVDSIDALTNDNIYKILVVSVEYAYTDNDGNEHYSFYTDSPRALRDFMRADDQILDFLQV